MAKIDEAIDYIKQLSLLVATYDNERLKTALQALKTMKWIEDCRSLTHKEVLQHFKEEV